MRILVLNSGSSSIKFSLFAATDEDARGDHNENGLRALVEGEASGLGTPGATLQVRGKAASAPGAQQAELKPGDGAEAASVAIARLFASGGALPGATGVDAIGYRVVHPGPRICGHCRLTPEVLAELKAAVMFAPLHQPPMLQLMESFARALPEVPAFCCFDTVFHETMPEEARTYALPAAVRARGVRRYGFHGISCEGVVRRLRERASRGGAERRFPSRLLVAHLGSGCSVTAIRDGASVENTMGLTPDGGVVMGTRPGDLDPGVVLFLLREAAKQSVADPVTHVEQELNQMSGTAAIAAMANDMKATQDAAQGGNMDALLAVRVFTRSVKKAIGSYVALLGGVDALVFTGGIGEHDAAARSEILEGLDLFGLQLAEAGNGAHAGENTVRRVSPEKAAAEVLVVRAEEDRTIAIHVREMIGADAGKSSSARLPPTSVGE